MAPLRLFEKLSMKLFNKAAHVKDGNSGGRRVPTDSTQLKS